MPKQTTRSTRECQEAAEQTVGMFNFQKIRPLRREVQAGDRCCVCATEPFREVGDPFAEHIIQRRRTDLCCVDRHRCQILEGIRIQFEPDTGRIVCDFGAQRRLRGDEYSR